MVRSFPTQGNHPALQHSSFACGSVACIAFVCLLFFSFDLFSLSLFLEGPRCGLPLRRRSASDNELSNVCHKLTKSGQHNEAKTRAAKSEACLSLPGKILRGSPAKGKALARAAVFFFDRAGSPP
jgi:hypothetical protein